MTKLSSMKVWQAERTIKRLGFQLIRQKGSHAIYEHPDGRITMLPIHYGEDIGKGLLKKIIEEDLKMMVDEFMKLK